MLASDTWPEARRRQIEAYRRMTPARRVELAVELSEEVWELAADGIRARHPGYGPDEVATSSSSSWSRSGGLAA